MRATWSILAAALISACGSAELSESEVGETHAGAEEMPASDRDPIPYTPPPASEGSTGETTSLVAAGGEDQARQLLPTFVRAVRDGDERVLEQLLSEEVAQARGRSDSHLRPRSAIVQRILDHARRTAIRPDIGVEELIELSAVRVSRAAQFWQDREIPDGVWPSDVVVEVPLLDEGRAAFRAILGWDLRGHLVVRPGRDPRIVAL